MKEENQTLANAYNQKDEECKSWTVRVAPFKILEKIE
jgi:hypothetical protein